MSYGITGSVGRCTFDTNTGGRCALVEGHQGQLHVTPPGEYFAERGGKVFGPNPQPEQPTYRPFSEWWKHSNPITPTKAEVAELAQKVAAVREDLRQYALQAHINRRFETRDRQVADLAEQTKNTAELAQNLAGRLGVVERSGRLTANDAFQRNLVTGERLAAALDDATKTLRDEAGTAVAEAIRMLSGRITALHSVEYGGGLAGMRRDINRLVGLVGHEAWNGRKELATTERLDDVAVQGKITAEAVERLEQDTATEQLLAGMNNRLAVLEKAVAADRNRCMASNSYDDKLCVLAKGHGNRHTDDGGETW